MMVHRRLSPGTLHLLVPLLSVAVSFAFAQAGTGTSSEPAPGVVGPPPGVYSGPQVLIPASLASDAAIEYRFAGQESWYPFDRPVYLSAFAGEDRTYVVEFRKSGSTPSSRLSYTIDMRPPEPPLFSVPPGDAGPALDLALSAEGDVFISVDRGTFARSAPGATLQFRAVPGSTTLVDVAAYAVDTAGNVSSTAHGRWRVYPQDLTPSFPMPVDRSRLTVQSLQSAAGIEAQVLDQVGSARLSLNVPEGAVPCAAVNAEAPFSSVSSFAVLSGSSRASSGIIPFPWGYERELRVHVGYLKDGIISVSPVPVILTPRFPLEDSASAPGQPVQPSSHVESGRATLVWPVSPWTTFVAVGSGDFVPYREPLVVLLGADPVDVRFYSLGHAGSRSSTGTIRLPATVSEVEVSITGVTEGGMYGVPVMVKPVGATRIRMETSEGDAPVPLLTRESRMVDSSGIRFQGVPGKVVRYNIRYGAEGDALRERRVSFTIDREAPPVPAPISPSAGYSPADTIIAFKPLEGTILVSVSENGDAPFNRYMEPIPLEGSLAGRRKYRIRAYAVDSLGNRSAEMTPFDIIVDKSSVYAAEGGKAGATGTPDSPYGTLDEAILAALRTGRRFIYVRGTVPLRNPVSIRNPLTIMGGFDDSWNESSQGMARLSCSTLDGGSVFVVEQTDFELKNLRIEHTGTGSHTLIDAREGSVTIGHSNLSSVGGVELSVIRAVGSTVRVDTAEITVGSALTARFLDMTDGTLKLTSSSLKASPTVSMVDAIRLTGSVADITGVRMNLTPALSLSALYARTSTVRIDRTMVYMSGGISSCRFVSLDSSNARITSVYMDVEWNGMLELFGQSGSSRMDLAHITALLRSTETTFLSSRSAQYSLLNSIVVSERSGNVTLIRGSGKPAVDSLAGNNIWGFSVLYDDGSVRSASVAALNGFVRPSVPNISEAPGITFSAEVKGMRRLAAGSACVDAAIPLDWVSSTDVLGGPRPSVGSGNRPDIGAEEL